MSDYVALTLPKTNHNNKQLSVPRRRCLRFLLNVEDDWIPIANVITAFREGQDPEKEDGVRLIDKAPWYEGNALAFHVEPLRNEITLRFLIVRLPDDQNDTREIVINLQSPFSFPMTPDDPTSGIICYNADRQLLRGKLLHLIKDTALGEPTESPTLPLVWMYGPNCSGKSTLLKEALTELKSGIDGKECIVVELNSRDLRTKMVWEFRRVVYLNILQACFGGEVGEWDRKLMPIGDYRNGTASEDLRDKLVEKKDHLSDRFLVISLDEIDRFAQASDNNLINAKDAIAILTQIVDWYLRGLPIKAVAILVDWNPEVSDRCPDNSSLRGRIRTFAIGNLNSDEVVTYTKHVLVEWGIAAEAMMQLAKKIYSLTNGNPLFMNALLNFVLSRLFETDMKTLPDLELAAQDTTVIQAAQHALCNYRNGEDSRLSDLERSAFNHLVDETPLTTSQERSLENLEKRGLVTRGSTGISLNIPILRRVAETHRQLCPND